MQLRLAVLITSGDTGRRSFRLVTSTCSDAELATQAYRAAPTQR